MTATTADRNPGASPEQPAGAANRSRSRSAASGGASKRSTGGAKSRRSTGGGAQRAKATGTTRSAGQRQGAAGRTSTRDAAASRKRTAKADGLAGYAERAVLIPVGAALIARDRLVDDVGGVISEYSSPARAQAQLRRFERRGQSARGQLEREARRTRTRLERQLGQRRRDLLGGLDRIDGTVGLHERTASIARTVSTQVGNASGRLERSSRALKDGVPLTRRIQDRFTAAP